MPEKIKITKAEIAELYDVIDDSVEKVTEEQIEGNASFESFTEEYDKKQEKEFREN